MPACTDCSGTARLTGTLDFSQGRFDDLYDEIFSLDFRERTSKKTH
jgi:hypothetical protein